MPVGPFPWSDFGLASAASRGGCVAGTPTDWLSIKGEQPLTVDTSQVAADARWCGAHGIGRYASELLRHIGFQHVVPNFARPASSLDPLLLRRYLLHSSARVFYSPGYNAALTTRVRQLLTVHDLIHLDVRAERSISKRLYYRNIVRPAIRRAGAVVTVSDYSATRIAKWAGVSPECVFVSRCGLSDVFQSPNERGESLVRKLTQRPYVLFVGDARPHRRFELLQGAMNHLPEYDLVTVGTVVRPSRARYQVHQLSHLSDRDMARLYRDAACVAVPSELEGFGLPVLEAMSQGTSVVWRADACGEIASDLGVRAPRNADERVFAQALRRAVEMTADERCSTSAVERAQEYTWEKAACVVRSALSAVQHD